ncbi:MAG TPA: hypothetical protein VJV23_16900 [Candidatus Polarisedimenticolia bacterium]|nr:hypothetical protein [Candidatus Polarisedimenticolia bacterium]
MQGRGVPASRLAFMLRRAAAGYEVFWDPEGVAEQQSVRLATKDPELEVTTHAPARPRVDEGLPRKVLADRAGRYNNAQKLAAAMLGRKRLEEGLTPPFERGTVAAALEAERRLSRPSPPLIVELERTVRAGVLAALKGGGDAAVLRAAFKDLAGLQSLPEGEAAEIADHLPSGLRAEVCAARGGEKSLLRSLQALACGR